MRRTALVAILPAAVIAATWLRLEAPRDDPTRAVAIVLIALVPALVGPRWGRIAACVAAVVIGARVAFGSWLHPIRVVSAFKNGFLDFYDVKVPFDPRVHAEMRSVILVAVFGFALALGLFVAARRPLGAALVVLVGAGWPATLAGHSRGLGTGVAILLAVLVLLAGLTARRVPRTAVVAGAVLTVAAVAVSSAVAKGQLVNWQGWDFYNAPDASVSVSFVWNAQYGGIDFPRKRTTVLEIKAPPTALYWRAATLDRFAGDRWSEAPLQTADLLKPPQANDRRTWTRQVVTVKALTDSHLIGAATETAFDAGDAPIAQGRTGGSGTSFLPNGLTRGFRYTMWSEAPQPTPAQLNRSTARYPAVLTQPRTMLDVWPGVTAPAFGTPGRTQRLTALLDAHQEISRYIPLEKAALRLGGAAHSPYAAAISLESWFRTRGGFTYSNHPAEFSDAPLVGFVVETRAGYCQYFAGAMALMLRYLGVPARVAVGFSSGTYDARSGVWTVTDHDAHAWVEAWFRGYGWLPFDPTPGTGRPERGQLAAPYSAASPRFSLRSTGIRVAGGPIAPAQAAHRHGEDSLPAGGGSAATAVSAPSRAQRSLLLILALLVAVVLAGITLTKLGMRRLRYASRDPRRVAAACRQELADFLLDQRIDAARSATLHELGALVRDELAVDPDLFVAAATAARFGPPAGARPAARIARRELRALLRVVRARLTFRERLRGLLSLRSLGFAP